MKKKTPLPPPDLPVLTIPSHLRRSADDGRGRRCIRYPDLSVDATAREIGVSPSYLSYILSGRRQASVRIYNQLAGIFQTTVDRLLSLYTPHLYKKRRRE